MMMSTGRRVKASGSRCSRRRSLLLILVLGALFSSAYPSISGSDRASLIFISDTQDPLWFERIILAENNNIAASALIMERIVAEKPAAVFHLGDLVALGFSESSWGRIDSFLIHLKRNQIPFYPTLGNHELLFRPDRGAEQFMRRFPEYSPTGYMIRVDHIAVLMMNSNFGYPESGQIEQQQRWYRQTLDYCEQDTSVYCVIVAAHHSPYTNSKVVSSDEDVQTYLVPDFLESPKTVLFLSGHAHAFEHFYRSGKDFMVIGGGGGLQQPLATGAAAEFDDLYTGPEKRPFHFLKVTRSATKIDLAVYMVNADQSGFEIGYRTVLPFHRPHQWEQVNAE